MSQRAPVIAVSPIIAGRAVKGPTAKMMTELGLEVSAAAVARRYQDLLRGYVLDRADAAEAEKLGIPVTLAHILMTTLADREELAWRVLTSADALAKATVHRDPTSAQHPALWIRFSPRAPGCR